MHVRMRVDDCYDRVIQGKRGDVHRCTLRGVSGYYVSVMYSSVRKFHIELAKCAPFGQITQEGDTEAVVFIPRSVALANARVIRAAINARRIKELSPEDRAARSARMKKFNESASRRAVVSN